MSEQNLTRELPLLGGLNGIFTRLDKIFSGIDSSKKGPQINRRIFIRGLGLLGASIALAACGKDEKPPSPTQTPEPTQTPTPLPTATPTEVSLEEALDRIEETITSDNLKLYLDKHGIPIGYEIFDTETTQSATGMITLDWQQRQAFQDAIEANKQTNDPQVVNFVIDDVASEKSIWDYLPPKPPTAEHPWVTELPPDIVDSEKLAHYGLRILTDPSSDAPQLFIREGAFQTRGLLQALPLLNEGVPYAEKTNLDIFIINAPLNWLSLLTPEQTSLMPESFKALLAEDEAIQTHDINEFRTALINGHMAEIKDFKALRQRLLEKEHPDATTISDIDTYNDCILDSEEHIVFLQSLTPIEIYFRYGQEILNYAKRMWYRGRFSKISPNSHRSVISVPAGDAHTKIRDKVIFSYNGRGKLEIKKRSNILFSDQDTVLPVDLGSRKKLPTIGGSYPQKSDFINLNPEATYENGQYPYGFQEIGQALRHEIVHGWLMSWLVKLHERGKLDSLSWFNLLLQDTNTRGNTPIPTNNEWMTDMLGMLTIEQAERFFEKYGDDSLYSFVFSIPENKHNPQGGFLITQGVSGDQA